MNKIVYVTPHLSTGGLPEFLYTKIKYLIDIFDIYVIEYSNYSDEYVVQKNKIRKILKKENIYTLSDNKFEIIDILNNINPNIIHFEEIPEYFIDIDIIKQIYNKQNRNYYIVETSHNLNYNLINKKFIPDYFIHVSSFLEEKYKQFNVNQTTIEYPVIKKSYNKLDAIRKLKFDHKYKHVLNVGLFTPNKNQGQIFEIAKYLENENIKFHFIGNLADNFKFYWKDLLDNVPKNCIIHGEKDNVEDYYAASDLFLFTSKLELNPLVLKEAMSFNLPIALNKLDVYGSKYDNNKNIYFLHESDNKYNADLIKNILFNYNINTSEQYDIEYSNDEENFKNKFIEVYTNLHKIENNILDDKFIVHFVDGAYLEIIGISDNIYDVYFIDTNTNEIIYNTQLKSNTWAKTSRKWCTDWKIQVFKNSELVFEHIFNCKGKNVYIALDSKSLGDTIAWFPYIEEFRKKHNCNVICSTFWNNLFDKKYNNIKFIKPGEIAYDLYAMFRIGIFDDFNLNKKDTKTQPLQFVACDILNLEYKEIKPLLNDIQVDDYSYLGDYVCISQHSTAQAKYWNNISGWQELVDYLNLIGYKVVVISKEPTDLKNVIDLTKNFSIEERICQLKGAKAFIGLSSGLSWLAWAVDIPVVLISGHTEPWYEFKCSRIYSDLNVCRGCWHKYQFDKSDWNWCPVNKNTSKQFECTKTVDSNKVINEIKKILSINDNIQENIKYCDFYININDNNPTNLSNLSHITEKNIYNEIFNLKIYEYEPYVTIEPEDIVFDIGAHIGIFTRYAALKGAKIIYSFEPEDNNSELFIKNKPNNCKFNNIGIFDKSGVYDFYIDSTSGGHSAIYNNDFNTKTNSIEKISFTNLDDIIHKENINQIDFIKIDTEGSEIKILNGISDENINKIKKWAIEYHHNVFNYDNKIKNNFIKRFISNGFKYREKQLDKNFYILYFWK